jgi:HTH-type transcriptional regulator/antitoxin MqsA
MEWPGSPCKIAQFLRGIRKSLGLRQADVGRLLGGGARAFFEYKRGKTQPYKSTQLLLKLLGNHPVFLKVLTFA